MKNLFSLAVLTALVAFGGAFVGKWKIPGLENLPTVDSLKNKSKPGDPVAEGRLDQGGRPAGYFSTGANSASSDRNKHLQNAKKDIGVE